MGWEFALACFLAKTHAKICVRRIRVFRVLALPSAWGSALLVGRCHVARGGTDSQRISTSRARAADNSTSRHNRQAPPIIAALD